MNTKTFQKQLADLSFQNLANVDKVKEIFSTDIEELQRSEDNSLDLIFLRPKINDLRRINEYFIYMNGKLIQDGLCVCQCETIEQRNYRIYKKSKKYTYIIRPVDFIYKRIFPKLKLTRRIYFAISKGNNRVLSKSEVLGRFYYCGFKLIKMEEVDNRLHFIVKKVKEPSQDPNPSYSPLFRMKKIGRNNEPVYIYKLRTMYPYSEYLRDFVLEKNGYALSGDGVGKVKDDFRVTCWGKIFRKYWLDELPQILNVLKGDLKLVGHRPLTESFLKVYPKEFLKWRAKFKPGLLPPYAAHIHRSIEEYIESEMKYFKSYEKHPLLTDVRYFFWIIYNILAGKIKSQ